jgi:hypothetical protein
MLEQWQFDRVRELITAAIIHAALKAGGTGA